MAIFYNRIAIGLVRRIKRFYTSFFGHRDYQKFVIISRSRTGSTFLMSLLDSHPNIECVGEIFKNTQGIAPYTVWVRYFAKRLKRTKAVGFRLFYYHPENGDQKVWELLKADSSIVIVHLTRQHLLRMLLSQRIGVKTNRWKQRENEKTPLALGDKQICLSISECEAFFLETKRFERETRQSFCNHTLIDLVYEDLVANKSLALLRVFEGLQVPTMATITDLTRQNKEALSELCINYLELKTYFTDSEWAYLFEE